MATKSFQLPLVEKVRPGIWCIPVPLPMAWLRYVLVYVFETDRGPYIVDAGWNTEEGFDALSAGLEGLGSSINDVQGVLVTHMHPDHFGLAGRVKEASGAWIGLHPADAALIHDRFVEPEGVLDRVDETLRHAGFPLDAIPKIRASSTRDRPLVTAVKPDIFIEDGDRPDVPGWDLLAVWTPGHSPGHLCFVEKHNQVFLSGDHVLPRITPNIALHPQASSNPLGDYLHSLDRISSLDVKEVFPAHEKRFLNFRERISEIQLHHEKRLAEVIVALSGANKTAWDVAGEMTWSRPWDEIKTRARRAAILEALAHLRLLETNGRVRELRGEPSYWELCP